MKSDATTIRGGEFRSHGVDDSHMSINIANGQEGAGGMPAEAQLTAGLLLLALVGVLRVADGSDPQVLDFIVITDAH